MRFEIRHPTRAAWLAVYGHNPTLGWFCTLYQDRRIVVAYSARTAPRNRMAGVLWLHVHHGYFEAGSVAQAYDLLQVVDCLEDIEDHDIRRAAEVIQNLKKAGNQE